MSDTNKLAELIKQAKTKMWDKIFHGEFVPLERNMFVADYLLANGVIAPPCKVGDIVWFLVKGINCPFEAKVNKIVIQQAGVVMSCGLKGYYSDSFTINDIGKTVFLTKEEAEAELRKRGKENG